MDAFATGPGWKEFSPRRKVRPRSSAYRKLRASGFFSAEDKVVLFNTGSGLKYLDVIESQKKA